MDAPDIVGAQMPAIRSSLAGGVPVMSFIELNERELAAVAAYVRRLAEPEPRASNSPAAGAPTRVITVNVDITEEGFQPASISIPLGQMVQLVVRNRTMVEHHYRVVGLVPKNLLWLADPPTERLEGVSDDEHEAHHATDFVAWRAPSPSGIQPTGDEVHAWAHIYAPGGGKDVILFAATNTGTFQVVNPLHPEMVGNVTVY
jgi:plastocyanin